MGAKNLSNRREFLMGNLCLVAAVSLTGTASAVVPNTWDTITAKELSPRIGDLFSVNTESNRQFRLRLVKVIASNSGPARPSYLMRKEGLTAVFVATKADCQWLLDNGQQNVQVWHHALGNSQLFLGAVPNGRGGYFLEAVLD